MYSALRPLLFRLPPEPAHHLALSAAAGLGRSATACELVRRLARPATRPVRTMGLHFPHPVGLAGGMDKDAVAPLAWWAFGFAFLELGTVTPRPQPGNPKPRMFRLPDRLALVNRMGFNNHGAATLAKRLAAQRRAGLRPPVPVGVSVGKNKDTPADRAADDFAAAAAAVAAVSDFLTVNVSSPNTPGLRALQTGADVGKLVAAVRAAAPGLPVLVKVAPELAGGDLDAVLDAAVDHGAAGVIATNTLGTTAPTGEPAGLSGRPLRDTARQVVAAVRRRVGDRATVIGCGGVDDAPSARALLDAGADLVQVYTGLVYRGPFLPAAISRGLGSGRSGS
jgi:dihydroorotate dehydrogenase